MTIGKEYAYSCEASSFPNEPSQLYEDNKTRCLKKGELFEDPEFPANDSSIFYSRSPPKPFVWLRPMEIAKLSGKKADFFVGGASRFDVKQGELGDCWLLAALSCLTNFPDLTDRIIPPNQNIGGKDYCGIFRFRLWRFGAWREVVVDDRLPTYNGRIVFMHSTESNEFWSSLLEKAYAKVCGSYEALKGGATNEAFVDFTGGVAEVYDFTESVPPNLFSIMLKAHEKHSLMGCSIDATPNQMEKSMDNGLIMGHAYSITAVKMIDIATQSKSGKIPLIRIRNPWGNAIEWKGRWSDKSPEWKFISEDQRKEVGLVFENDGEFWMSYPDFTANFTKLELCNLGPDSLDDDSIKAKKRWEMSLHEGGWRKKVSAGGCRNFLDTFWTNPQFYFEVTDADEDDNEDMGTVIIGLLQKERRKKRVVLGEDLLTMGYAIYKAKGPNQPPLGLDFFKYNASVARAPNFINLREVCGRHRLPTGGYILVPSTFESDQEGDFIIRIFSEKPANVAEIDDISNHAVIPIIKPSSQDVRIEKELKDAFRKISGSDMEIDAFELMEVLNAVFMKDFKFDGFSLDTCRSLVAMKDVDKSGKLGFEEFKTLWNQIRVWKLAFRKFDKDNSGNFNGYELRDVLKDIGITLNNQTFNAVVQRYSFKDGKIYFDDYIHLLARLTTMFDMFKSMSKGKLEANFPLDMFLMLTMYS